MAAIPSHPSWSLPPPGGSPLRVAGVLSGTSADGIDVALVECAWSPGRVDPPQLIAFRTEPFDPALIQRLRPVLDGHPTDLRAIALLNRDLGRAFGAAARGLALEHEFELDLVGSHGQTVWHHDGDPACGPASLQLGDGDCVAAAAGAATVSDFRQGDLALGGEGAPLSAYADDLVFAAAARPLAVLNLGGMGNLSWVGRSELIAFDTGPAGALLDGLARLLLDQPLDRAGAVAASGSPWPELVAELLSHPFLQLPLPRSTGRDTFGWAWVDGFAQRALRAGASIPDIFASATEFVASSVALGMRSHLPALPSTLWVAGGGVHNLPLMAALQRLTATSVQSSGDLGVPPDAREALVFAVLAARFVAGQGYTQPSATGAQPGRVLGKWSPGPAPPTFG